MEILFILLLIFVLGLFYIYKSVKWEAKFTLESQQLSTEDLAHAVSDLLDMCNEKLAVKNSLKLNIFAKELFRRKRVSKKARF